MAPQKGFFHISLRETTAPAAQLSKTSTELKFQGFWITRIKASTRKLSISAYYASLIALICVPRCNRHICSSALIRTSNRIKLTMEFKHTAVIAMKEIVNSVCKRALCLWNGTILSCETNTDYTKINCCTLMVQTET